MSMSADAIQLATLLSTLTQPDTAAIRNAEATLKPILKDARCVPALMEVLMARGAQVCFNIEHCVIYHGNTNNILYQLIVITKYIIKNKNSLFFITQLAFID